MATYGKARVDTIAALRNMQPFKRSGFGMYAIDGAVYEMGRLDEELVKSYRSETILYTVVSYATPIAWVTVKGDVVIPDDSYSRTTSTHQGMCRSYLAKRA